MEEIIRNMLTEVLGGNEKLSTIGIDDELMEVGLDSLKAIELIVYIEDEYDITIADDDLLIDNISTINKIMDMIHQYGA